MAKKSAGKTAVQERGSPSRSMSETSTVTRKSQRNSPVEAAAGQETRAPKAARPSALLDTRVIYCGDNLEQLAKLPDACVDLIYPATAGRPRCVQLARVLKQTGSLFFYAL